jgi:hypothetical protein
MNIGTDKTHSMGAYDHRFESLPLLVAIRPSTQPLAEEQSQDQEDHASANQR